MKLSLLFSFFALVLGVGFPVLASETSQPGGGVTQITAGSGVTLDPSDGKGSVEITAAGGGDSNQDVNTSTNPLYVAQFTGGGSLSLSTSPFVALPGKVLPMFGSTFNVTSVQAYIAVNSTASDANITFRIAESTSRGFGFGNWSYISSSMTVISSSDTTSNGQGGWKYSAEVSTAFTMQANKQYSIHIPSAPPVESGLPAENWTVVPKGWWSP